MSLLWSEVRIAIPTSSTTFDVTDTGEFGTDTGKYVSAELVPITAADGDNSPAAYNSASYGFSDGIKQVYAATFSENAQATTDTCRACITGAIGKVWNSNKSASALVQFDSFITGGVRLSVDWGSMTPAAFRLLVTIAGGDDLTGVYVDTGNTPSSGTTQLDKASFQPNLMIGISARNGSESSESNHGALTVGYAINDTGHGVVNCGYNWYTEDSNTTARIATRTDSTHWSYNTNTFNSFEGGHYFTGFDSDGAAIAAGSGTIPNNYYGYAMLGIANHRLWAGVIQSKTTAGTEAKTGLGFKPRILKCVPGRNSSQDQDKEGQFGFNGAFGFGSAVTGANGNVEYYNGVRDQNWVGTSATQAMQDSVFINARRNAYDTTSDVVATVESYDDDGFTLNYTEVDAGGIYFPILAIEENAAVDTGVPSYLATGAATIPALTAAGSGTNVPPVQGVGSGTIPAPTASGLGKISIVGSGAATIPAPTAAGSGGPANADESYFDHMTGLVDSHFVEVGNGTFSYTDGYVDLTGAANTAHFLQHVNALDTGKSWAFATMFRSVATTTQREMISLWGSSGGVGTTTDAAASGDHRFAVDVINGGMQLKYWNAAGTEQWWDGSAWTGSAVSPITMRQGANADWYGAVLEYDQPNSRARWLAINHESTTADSRNQGYRIITFTDWVATGDVQGWEDLYFTIGNRYTDGSAFDLNVEFVDYHVGTSRQQVVSNDRRVDPNEYLLVQNEVIDDTKPYMFPVADIGMADEGWESTGTQGRRGHAGLLDGSNYRLYYESFVSTGYDTALGAMTNTDPEDAGNWTYSTNNPIIDPDPDIGSGYVNCRTAGVIKNTSTDMYRLYVSAEAADGNYRIFLFESSEWDGGAGGWTKIGGTGTDGAILEEWTPATGVAQYGVNGVSDPNVQWDEDSQQYIMFFSGYRNRPADLPWNWDDDDRAGWATFRATSPNGVTWTIQNSGLPIIAANTSKLRSFSSTPTNNSIEVTDHAAFEVDEPLILRDDDNSDGIPTRVRTFPDATHIEVYHRMEGWTNGDLIASLVAGSITPGGIYQQTDGTWRMYLTVFQPFINGGWQNGSGSPGDIEQTLTATADSLDSDTWTVDFWMSAAEEATAAASKENISLYGPTYATPVGTGSGTITAPTAAGAGKVVYSGSGSGTVGAPTASGTGSIPHLGSGSGTVSAATAAGAGKITYPGSGSATVPAPTASGAGSQKISGSGSATVPAPTAAGTGTNIQVIIGSGAATIPAPTASGAGKQTFVGSGSATVGAPTASGSGSSGSIGAGSGTVPAPTAAGTGKQTISGSGAATVPAPTSSGTAKIVYIGSGSGSVSAPTAAGGTGQVIGEEGVGSGTIPAPTANGTGKITYVGSGAAVISAPTGSGSGTVPVQISGSGSGTIGGASAAGTGKITYPGSGSGTVSALTASGSAKMVFVGSGSGTVSAPTGSGIGSATSGGVGNPVIPGPTANGTGKITYRGSGAATIPAPTAAGLGTPFPMTGSGSMSIPAPTAAGTGLVSSTLAAVVDIGEVIERYRQGDARDVSDTVPGRSTDQVSGIRPITDRVNPSDWPGDSIR